VARVADGFRAAEFHAKVAKFVRKNHVQTAPHWCHGQPLVKNGLARPGAHPPKSGEPRTPTAAGGTPLC
jgi:hypothetical protein